MTRTNHSIEVYLYHCRHFCLENRRGVLKTVKGTTLTIPVTSMLMIVMILRMNILGFNYSLTRIMYIYIHTEKSYDVW